MEPPEALLGLLDQGPGEGPGLARAGTRFAVKASSPPPSPSMLDDNQR